MNEPVNMHLTVISNEVQPSGKPPLDISHLLADQTSISTPTSDDDPYGAAVVPVPWSPPETITDEMILVAQAKLDRISPHVETACADSVRKWLYQLALATATSGVVSPEELDGKLTLYSTLLRKAPAGAFTMATLERAIERFKFFPVGQELLAFVREESDKLIKDCDRLRAIIDTGPRQGPPKWSKEAADAHREKLRLRKEQENRELAQAIKERDASASVVGTMKPLALSLPKIGKE